MWDDTKLPRTSGRVCRRHKDASSYHETLSLGVLLVKMKNVFVPVKRVHSVNTYSWISTIPQGSERSEWVSPWMEQASEVSGALQSEWAEWVRKFVYGVSKQSQHCEAERCGASERSERCERANERSERPSGPFKTRLSLTRKTPCVRVCGH